MTQRIEKLSGRDDAVESVGGPIRWKKFHGSSRLVAAVQRNADQYPLKGFAPFPVESGSPMQIAQALRQAYVQVFGLGAVGGESFRTLTRLGVGRIDAVDPDDYDELSHLTQPARYSDAGQPKAWVQAVRAFEANPAVLLRAGIGYAQDMSLRELRAASIFVVAGDNAALAFWVGRMAMALGKVVVQMAVDGNSSSAIVRGYDLREPDTAACPMCGSSRWELAQQSYRHGCAIGATGSRAKPRTDRGNTTATRTSPIVCSTASQLGCAEVLKWLAGHEHLALRGEELLISLLTYRQTRTMLKRRESCPAPHRRWQLVDIDMPPDQVSLDMLARSLAGPSKMREIRIRSEIPWYSTVDCDSCGRKATIRRFARPAQHVGHCRCGAALHAAASVVRSIIPREDLPVCRDRSLADLGLRHGEAVGMQSGNEWTYFFMTLPPENAD